MRVCSCAPKPHSAAIWRARWRDATTSNSAWMATVRMRAVMKSLCPDDDDCRIVAHARKVPVQHGGDQARMTGRQAGIGIEVPARADAVRMQDELRARLPQRCK